MAEYFYDTSAAVKHYRTELGTAKIDSLLADTASHHYLSNLGVVEIHSVFQQAQQLLVQHATTRSLRTLDALQLVVALGLRTIAPLDDFICADANLVLIATAEGLSTINPEVP
jgi:predicted nucleic acid-binding protein